MARSIEEIVECFRQNNYGHDPAGQQLQHIHLSTLSHQYVEDLDDRKADVEARAGNIYNDEFKKAGFAWNERNRQHERPYDERHTIVVKGYSCRHFFEIHRDGMRLMLWPFEIRHFGQLLDLVSALEIPTSKR